MKSNFLALSQVGVLLAMAIAAQPCMAKGRKSADAAVHLDKLLAEHRTQAQPEQSQSVPQMDDEGFLRRVSLDLLGQTPSPEELTKFVLDPDPNKRGKAIDRYLADSRFGENWARYWRDVILYRRTEERALLAAVSVTDYLTQKFNDNAGWDEIAKDFFTAKGDLSNNGATAVIASQWGETVDVASEYARIFLGIQIQCAQCHDHLTDRWKRTQFHELSAFFARVGVRRNREDGDKARGFSAIATDDPDGDGKPYKGKGKGRGRPREHYMPDLEDPSAKGTLMQPVFFLTGQKLEPGTSDAERRAALADWVVSDKDPWFAKSFVNRVWAELTGRGFYEPIDDLGPDRTCEIPQAMDFLASQFRQHEFDVKWLYRTIASTQHYQRAESAAQPTPSAAQTALCTCTQRLRSDQLFNTLTTALAVDVQNLETGAADKRKYGLRAPRAQFNQAFGFDPSSPDDDVQLSIPQALLLMNSPPLAAAMNGKLETGLKRLLADSPQDEAVVEELYLRCLGREPRDSEVATCLSYVKEVGSRTEAFEDILWSLVNSTELLYRN